MSNPHLAGPWKAILSDRNGDIYDTVNEARINLGPHAEVEISVRRGTALPETELIGATLPGSNYSGDVACTIDAYLGDPHDEVGAEARYAQAQAMAAGLNTAAKADD